MFAKIASKISHAMGTPAAFAAATISIVIWGISGPLFAFSDTWQLVVNTGTTVLTFLMVFLIQNAQNRESLAIQVKLDELIAVTQARNELQRAEQLDEKEIEELRD